MGSSPIPATMKKAKDILDEELSDYDLNIIGVNSQTWNNIIDAIKQAQKDAIEEAFKRALEYVRILYK